MLNKFVHCLCCTLAFPSNYGSSSHTCSSSTNASFSLNHSLLSLLHRIFCPLLRVASSSSPTPSSPSNIFCSRKPPSTVWLHSCDGGDACYCIACPSCSRSHDLHNDHTPSPFFSTFRRRLMYQRWW